MVPLSDEIQHVKDYLKIEEARFEEKLEIVFIEEIKSDILVPVLILQPMIENAVRYGISSDGHRHVSICISKIEDHIRVTIEDKGPGIPEEVMSDLEVDNDLEDHIGLINVNRRLKNIYGEDRGLNISSSSSGTIVEINFYGDNNHE